MPGVRDRVNFTFRTHQTFHLGRLQMLARIPVLAGDSLKVRTMGGVRLHPMRRQSGVDIKSEIFAFYVPYRWTYGEDFVTAAIEGYNGTTSYAEFDSITTDKLEDLPALLYRTNNIPRHILSDYAAIVDHYFKERHTAEVTRTNVLTSDTDLAYGYLCWQMMSWETAMNWNDAHDTAMIDTDGGDVAALDLAHYVALGRDEQVRRWDAVRREEIYQHTYGGKLNPEAEQIPTLLMHRETMMQEYGQSVAGMEFESVNPSQAAASVKGRIPRRFFPEHGTIYIFNLNRVRPSYRYSQHYLDIQANFQDPKKLLAHPAGASAQPLAITLANLFSDTESSTVSGYYPNLHWYRGHPDYWNRAYSEVDSGWPARPTPATQEALKRHPDYSDTLTSNQFEHGMIHAKISVQGRRNLGRTTDSVKMPDLGRTENI